ncbi:hypothetical protein PENSPDRAFT_204054 [Peniophora sp. CONT]|nr:hypothetical protein PENSPDRAFT_204054 [Peniophora sp. CONT]
MSRAASMRRADTRPDLNVHLLSVAPNTIFALIYVAAWHARRKVLLQELWSSCCEVLLDMHRRCASASSSDIRNTHLPAGLDTVMADRSLGLNCRYSCPTADAEVWRIARSRACTLDPRHFLNVHGPAHWHLPGTTTDHDTCRFTHITASFSIYSGTLPSRPHVQISPAC